MKENIQALFDSNSEKCSLQCVRARHVNYSVGRCVLIESKGGGVTTRRTESLTRKIGKGSRIISSLSNA